MNQKRIELLKNFIEEEPNNPFNWYALAIEYFEWNEQEAFVIFKELIERFPAYLPTYYKYAHLLWEMGDFDNSEAVFKAGIKLAETQRDVKALGELKSAYQNFLFEKD